MYIYKRDSKQTIQNTEEYQHEQQPIELDVGDIYITKLFIPCGTHSRLEGDLHVHPLQ